jgi:uncharacterized protein (DUF4415 family)
MKRFRLDPSKPPRLNPAQAKRLAKARVQYGDIPPLAAAFFARAAEAPVAKQQLTIRLDNDVLSWLKSLGRGYQTRINRILRAAMDSQPR